MKEKSCGYLNWRGSTAQLSCQSMTEFPFLGLHFARSLKFPLNFRIFFAKAWQKVLTSLLINHLSWCVFSPVTNSWNGPKRQRPAEMLTTPRQCVDMHAYCRTPARLAWLSIVSWSRSSLMYRSAADVVVMAGTTFIFLRKNWLERRNDACHALAEMLTQARYCLCW